MTTDYRGLFTSLSHVNKYMSSEAVFEALPVVQCALRLSSLRAGDFSSRRKIYTQNILNYYKQTLLVFITFTEAVCGTSILNCFLTNLSPGSTGMSQGRGAGPMAGLSIG